MKINECLFIYLWEFPISSEFFGPTRICVRSWWLCSNHPATTRSSRQPSPGHTRFHWSTSRHPDAGDSRTLRGSPSCRRDRREVWRVRWRAGRIPASSIRVAFPKMKWLFNFLRKILIVIRTFWTTFDRQSVHLYVNKLSVTFDNFFRNIWSSIGTLKSLCMSATFDNFLRQIWSSLSTWRTFVCHQTVSHFS